MLFLGLPQLKKVVIVPYVNCSGDDATIGNIKNGLVHVAFVILSFI